MKSWNLRSKRFQLQVKIDCTGYLSLRLPPGCRHELASWSDLTNYVSFTPEENVSSRDKNMKFHCRVNIQYIRLGFYWTNVFLHFTLVSLVYHLLVGFTKGHSANKLQKMPQPHFTSISITAQNIKWIPTSKTKNLNGITPWYRRFQNDKPTDRSYSHFNSGTGAFYPLFNFQPQAKVINVKAIISIQKIKP